MKKLRVAVCFSGQLRSGIQSAPNLLNFIGELLPDCDFFVHTWDINTYRSPLNLRIPPKPPTKVSHDEFTKFNDIYKPKKINIENQKLYWDRMLKELKNPGDLIHLWYSFYHSIRLKKEYEDNNNFKYDIVVKLRPDCIFPPDRFLKDDITEYLADSSTLLSVRREDVYFMGTSDAMDYASMFYFNGGVILNEFWPLFLFEDYLKIKSIKFESFKDWRFTIFRPDYVYLDSIDNYYHLSAINSFIFEDINFAKNTHIWTYTNYKNPNYEKEMKENLFSLFDEESVVNYFNLTK